MWEGQGGWGGHLHSGGVHLLNGTSGAVDKGDGLAVNSNALLPGYHHPEDKGLRQYLWLHSARYLLSGPLFISPQ